MIPLHDENPTERFPWMTILLIVINGVVFFAWQMGSVGLEQSVKLAAFVPAKLQTHGVLAGTPTIFSSMFMHGGIMHLVGNMWFLWLFGNNIEDRSGPFRFLIFYLLCGIAATVAYTFFNLNSKIPLVGASGAISGVLGGYLLMFPSARILTLVPLGFFTRMMHIPAWFFLIIWMGFQLLNQAAMSGAAASGREPQGGVAFMAHIAGFVAGLLLIWFFKRKSRSRSF
jgi:membrane associated rhomboid family serine protease